MKRYRIVGERAKIHMTAWTLVCHVTGLLVVTARVPSVSIEDHVNVTSSAARGTLAIVVRLPSFEEPSRISVGVSGDLV